MTTFSSLISGTVSASNKYSSRNNTKITRIIQHHWAGTTGGDTRLLNPSQQVSVNYIVYSDGRIVGQVPEEYRAWTSGSFAADAPSITIECQNSTGAPEWKVSDEAIASIIKLCIDIAKRYNFGGFGEEN